MEDARKTLVYGLVEYGSDSDLSPLLLVGDAVEAVRREALAVIVDFGVENSNAGPEFILPPPDSDAADVDIEFWLMEFKEFATYPWLEILDSDQDVRFV